MRGINGEKGEGSSQGSCIKDPWSWTTWWGLIVGARCGVTIAGENNVGKIGTIITEL